MAAPYGQDGTYEQDLSQPGAPAAGAKKKRAYAGQAYEFGAGANAALGGQQVGAGQFGAPAQQPAGQYGYPAAAAQPAYGQPQQPAYDPAQQAAAAQPAYGVPAYGGQPGGYQPAQTAEQPSYQAQAGNMLQQGMQNVTSGFANMGFGGNQAQPAPQPTAGQPAQRLNPLVPVDISVQGQPFHVSELDQPPPAIILPPNVSSIMSRRLKC